MKELRVAVLVSGQGTNLRALIDATNRPGYPARVVLVCANREAPALEHARQANIPWVVFRRGDYPTRDARDRAMAVALRGYGVELVVCAGYDAILAPGFTREFAGCIVNIHPSLLPAFAGAMDAPARALAAGVKRTGCTVHLVTDDVDAGPILAQRAVRVRSGDTVEQLHARIKAEEQRLLPEVVRGIAERRALQPT